MITATKETTEETEIAGTEEIAVQDPDQGIVIEVSGDSNTLNARLTKTSLILGRSRS